MLSLLKRYRELLVVGLLLLHPFATFLATASKGGREPNFVDRAVIGLTTPLQSGLTWMVDGLASTWEGYVALRGVEQERRALEEENALLRLQLSALTEARAENERLKRLLAYSDSAGVQPVVARVVGVAPAANRLSLQVNRGEADGVHKGMPVVTADGVVGQVLQASAHAASVLLITDPTSRLGVRVQRSRYRATAVGTREKGSLPLLLENALRTDDLEEGDLIITSGTDGVFPPGLVVGRATALQRKNYGMFQSAQITPAVDVTEVEEVLVLPGPAVPATSVGELLR